MTEKIKQWEIKEKFNSILKCIKWLIWELVPMHWVYKKFRPEYNNGAEPVTIGVWLLATYIAFFGIASQRYENRLDLVENRITSIQTQLNASSSTRQNALNRIARTQHLLVPHGPDIKNPIDTILSLFGPEKEYATGVEILEEVITDWRSILSGIDIQNIKSDNEIITIADRVRAQNVYSVNLDNLILNNRWMRDSNLIAANVNSARFKDVDFYLSYFQGADFTESTFVNCDIREIKGNETVFTDTIFDNSEFDSSDLKDSNFVNSKMRDVSFQFSNLSLSSFSGGTLVKVNFQDTDLADTGFEEAKLENCDFTNAKNLTINQLCDCLYIKNCIFPEEIKSGIKKECPSKLIEK